ncbi:hypothetical protein [Thermoproteus tenax]|uniref:hypothetical protein n=1 Tax=Thermoproteus tenax TaxID=2271 RepID=UPI00069C2682|nr:hypothetical protein [Thermoproteus tenax]
MEEAWRALKAAYEELERFGKTGDPLVEAALANYWGHVLRQMAYGLIPYGCPADKIPPIHSANSSSVSS